MGSYKRDNSPLSPQSSHFTSNGKPKIDRYNGNSIQVNHNGSNNYSNGYNNGNNSRTNSINQNDNYRENTVQYNSASSSIGGQYNNNVNKIHRSSGEGSFHDNTGRRNSNNEAGVQDNNSGRRDRGSSQSSCDSNRREKGIVEKLLNSYGFVELPSNRQRVFFHYSAYNGDPDGLNIGDPLEFGLTTDNRNGKLLAVEVKKLAPGAVNFPLMESIPEERCFGTVEVAPKQAKNGEYIDPATLGRVSYNRNGEFFFLPFSFEDIEEGETIEKGNNVSFRVSTSKAGTLHVHEIRYAAPSEVRDPVNTVQGIISSLKETFGFIERSDVVAEIFFHYSEFSGDIADVVIGDDVQFELCNRQNKEIAVRVEKLAVGTVVFEDISTERRRGHIIKAVAAPRGSGSGGGSGGGADGHLTGVIEYQGASDTHEVLFGDRDTEDDISLQKGDVVEFNVSTDRRDKLQRAVAIKLMMVAVKNGQRRESGAISSLKDGFGFIRCAERELSIFFHYSEVLEQSHIMSVGDEVEFTIDEDTMSRRQHAVRIRFLQKGTVEFETVSKHRVQGVVEKVAPSRGMKSPSKLNKDAEFGVIRAELGDEDMAEILYSLRDISLRDTPNYNDIVEFTLVTRKANNARFAREISVVEHREETLQRGWVCALKENFGFIELEDHSRELFFHFSELDCDANLLELGDEVEFFATQKHDKPSGEQVTRISSYVERNQILADVYEGTVVQPMRTTDPEQDEYEGVLEISSTTRGDSPATTSSSGESSDENLPVSLANGGHVTNTGDRIRFSVTSMKKMKEPLQVGDKVKFQLCVDVATNKYRAANIQCKRKFEHGKIESIKGQFGFITFESEEGKSLFFHMTEVEDDTGRELQPGDDVQFVVVKSHKNAKRSAVKVSRYTVDDRPEHLTRRRSQRFSESQSNKSTVLRQPTGPDSSGGFKLRRSMSDTCSLIPVPSQAECIEVF